MHTWDPEYEEHRRRRLRNLIWIAPLAILGGIGLFFGIGHFMVWLWRQTVVELFAFKPITFWQAWGLILLSQILFKANVRPMTRTGGWRRRGRFGAEPHAEPTRPE